MLVPKNSSRLDMFWGQKMSGYDLRYIAVTVPIYSTSPCDPKIQYYYSLIIIIIIIVLRFHFLLSNMLLNSYACHMMKVYILESTN